MTCICDFCSAPDPGWRYLQHAPLPTSIPRKPEEMCPFLYTVAQIKNLLDVPDTAYHPRAHIEPHTMRAFLVLLYGTGLRPGEAMRLRIRQS